MVKRELGKNIALIIGAFSSRAYYLSAMGSGLALQHQVWVTSYWAGVSPKKKNIFQCNEKLLEDYRENQDKRWLLS